MATAAKTVLITGGRAPVSLELARTFAAAGCRVITAETSRHHLSRFSGAVANNYLVASPRFNSQDFITDLVRVVRREAVDLLVPTCEEVFYVSMGLAELAPYCRVFTEPLTVLDRLHNKYTFVKRAAQHGLTVPETVLLSSAGEARDYARRAFVLKPVYSRFANSVRLPPHGELELSNDDLADQTWLAQAYTLGKQVCTYSLASRGQLLAHSCYAARFRVGAGAAVQFEHLDHPGALAWVKTFVAAERLSGQFGFDFIETPAGVVALECNPRATSGVHLLAANPDFAAAFFATAPFTTALGATSDLVTPPAASAAMLSGAMLSGFSRAGWLKAFCNSRDVIYSPRDPLPAVLQGLPLLHFALEAVLHGVSFSAATTRDLEWNG